MGLLDYDFNQLAGNPLVQMGLGILANNQGHYGQFSPAFGIGASQGLVTAQQMQNAMQRQKSLDEEMKLRKDELDLNRQYRNAQMAEMQRQIDKDKRIQEWQSQYGTNNSFRDIAENVPAPQGTEAPNFNTVQQVTKKPEFNMQDWLMRGVAVGAVPIDKILKENDPIALSSGSILIGKDGKVVASNPAEPKDNSTPDIKNFQWAVANGYIDPKDPDAYKKFKQWGAMNPVALANLGIAQGGLALRERETDYTTPPPQKPKNLPKTKIFKLDDGSSASASLDSSVGKYYVMKDGKKHWVEE